MRTRDAVTRDAGRDHLARAFAAWGRLIRRWVAWLTAVVVALTLVLAGGLPRLEFDSGQETMVPNRSQVYLVEVLDPLDWSAQGCNAAADPDVVWACYDEITTRMQQALDRLVRELPHPVWTRLMGAIGVAEPARTEADSAAVGAPAA